jgi:hypothetical protein
MPHGLDSEEQLTYALGAIVRAEAAILRALLFLEYDLDGRDPDLEYRKDTDARTVNAVIAGLRSRVDDRHLQALEEVAETVRRRNTAVHTPWGSEQSGFYEPAELFMSNAVPPTAIEEFVDIADDLETCLARLTTIRAELRL